MQLSVYSGEVHQRNRMRYIYFTVIFGGLIVLSLMRENYVGAILLFFLLGGYIFYSVNFHSKTMFFLSENGLQIGKSLYPRNKFQGFGLEIDTKTQEIKNIVLMYANQRMIHTIDDEPENIKNFVTALNNIIPLQSNFNEGLLEKLMRRVQL